MSDVRDLKYIALKKKIIISSVVLNGAMAGSRGAIFYARAVARIGSLPVGHVSAILDPTTD